MRGRAIWTIAASVWVGAIVLTHAVIREVVPTVWEAMSAFRAGYATSFFILGVLLMGSAARIWPHAGPALWRPLAVVAGAVVAAGVLWLPSRSLVAELRVDMWMTALLGLALAAILPRLLPERWVFRWLRLERRRNEAGTED